MSGTFDLVIKGGQVIDGTGTAQYPATVATSDGKISVVGPPLDRDFHDVAAQVIDAAGKAVAPGFIDLHTHSDWTVPIHGRAESSVSQGVTTEVCGQCGQSEYPVQPHEMGNMRAWICEVSQADPAEMDGVTWSSLEEWREAIQSRGVSVNLAPLFGQGRLRVYTLGRETALDTAVLSPDQMGLLKAECAKMMDQGAFGMSSGLVYMPGTTTPTTELIELARVVAEHGGVYFSHVRSEDELLVPAAEELIRTAEESGARTSLTHHKAMHKENWGKSSVTLRLLREARERGVDVICDQYPWLMSQTSNLSSHFFPLAPGRGRKKDLNYVLDCVKDDATWAGMRADRERMEDSDRRYVASLAERLSRHGIRVAAPREFGSTTMVLHSPQHPEVEGQSLREAALTLGANDDWDAARRLYIDDAGQTLLAGGYMSEDDVVGILKWEHTAVSTDAWMLSGNPSMALPMSTPHPRFYGTFPRVLQRYVRELRVLSLEETIRRMTGLPADFLGLKDRGLIRPGYAADIVVFDPESVRSNGTYVNPCQHPDGISTVIVNGVVTVANSKHTGELAGRVLRK